MMSLAVVMFEAAGVITGQTAGLALLISKITGTSFGVVFVLVNAPFFALAAMRMGREFTIKTAIAIGAVAVMTFFLPRFIKFESIDPGVGAICAGVASAFALIALFRHRASLGGVGIFALYLQEKRAIPAGYTQLAFDLLLFGVAVFVLDPVLLIYSVVSAVTTNLIIAVNHRTDRYIAR